MNKTKAVLQHLREHSLGIVSWDAIQLYGATRLASIICNLIKKGYDIKPIDEYKDGEHWTRYVLKGWRTTGVNSRPQIPPSLFD